MYLNCIYFCTWDISTPKYYCLVRFVCKNVWMYSIILNSDHLPIFQSGMQAVRENRYIILSKDFEKAYKKAIRKDDQEHDFYK